MEKTISIRQAAIKAGISRQAIHKHLKVGRITMIDGKIDLASYQSWLQSRSQQDVGLNKTQNQYVVDKNDLSVFETLQDAELNKKSYEARLKELQFEKEYGEVVRVEDAAIALKAQCDLIRNTLKAFPEQVAPKLQQCKTVAEVQGCLHKEVVETLEKLSTDQSWMENLI